MKTLEISVEYAKRDNTIDWIKDYCKRNKIPVTITNKERHRWENTEPYIRLEFKSYHQRECFIRNGNKNYPYFEFC